MEYRDFGCRWSRSYYQTFQIQNDRQKFGGRTSSTLGTSGSLIVDYDTSGIGHTLRHGVYKRPSVASALNAVA